jgi:hypothetical protein
MGGEGDDYISTCVYISLKVWAPYDRGARTSTAHDTQRHATPPEPVPLHNISSTSSCVYSNHNVHMYTLNKVSTPLPLVLITSYCVGTSTKAFFSVKIY